MTGDAVALARSNGGGWEKGPFFLSLAAISTGAGSSNASIHCPMPYSYDNASAVKGSPVSRAYPVMALHPECFHLPSSGATHTLPASSSGCAFSNVLW